MSRLSTVSLERKLNEIEEDIAAGRIAIAQPKILAMAKGRVARADRLDLARCARRASLPDLAVRLLNPVVRPAPRMPRDATGSEKAEYAASLLRIGALREAVQILWTVDAVATPESLLFQAYALFAQWDYSQALPLLEKYVAAPGIAPYQRLIGKINLAACLVNQKMFDEADTLLEELRITLKRPSHARLYGNALELSAQNAILQGKLEEAEKILQVGAPSSGHAESFDSLFLEKWRAIGHGFRHGEKHGVTKLRAVREHATKLSHWETIRECDLFLGVLTRKNPLLVHVYFGSPFEGYRRRIFGEVKGGLEIPGFYLWTPRGKKIPQHGHDKHFIDLSTGEVRGSTGRLKPGHVLYRLLNVLASDFYRPFSLAALHSSVYADEYFNPMSGPLRVHQILRRLRVWLERAGCGLVVRETGSNYHLSATGPTVVRIGREAPTRDPHEHQLKILKKEFDRSSFSVLQASEVLRLSTRTALRVLQKGIEHGALQREGNASSTCYHFTR